MVLPFGAVAAATAVLTWRSGREATERDLQARAASLSLVVARELDVARATLAVLASSSTLDTGDLAGFYEAMQRVPRPEGTRIMLSDAYARMLVNSMVPFGTPLPRRGDTGIIGRVFESGEAHVSDLYTGPITNEPLIAIDVPVSREGRVLYDLSMGFRPAILGRVLDGQRPPGSAWVAAVLDGSGTIVARTPDMDAYLGRQATAEARQAIQAAEAGLFESPSVDGKPILAAFSRMPGSRWTVVVAIRQARLRAGLWRSLAGFGAGGAALLLFGLALAWHQSRRIAGAIGGLATPGAPTTGVREVEEAARALAEAATARDRATMALAGSEARLRRAQLAGGVHPFEIGPDGVAQCGDGLRALFGLPPGARFDHVTWSACLHPADRARMTAEFDRLAHEGGSTEIEYRVAPPGGPARWLLSRAELQPGEGGGPGTIVGVTLDVTGRRLAEERLRESEAQLRALAGTLEERVREEVAAREAAQDRLAQAEKLTALGQLAGGIAHDFNNVMQAVQGGAGLIRRRPEDAEGAERLAGMIEDATRRGVSITQRLLAFSRRGELRAEAVDVPALLGGLREVLAHTLGAGIEVVVEAPAGLPPVLADRGQLETALVNLATNARDAMPGGGRLTLSASEEKVAEGSRPEGLAPGSYIRIAASDTGTGMDAATLARAMEPFFTTKVVGKGTGLGLPMARGFAEQSGGMLGVSSEPGQGTTVALWLPVTSPMAEGRPGLPGSGGVAAGARILLVDDEDPVRDVLAEGLEDRGYHVLQAGSGPAALALIDAGEAVDLLVSDLSMPGMDGVALIGEAQRRRPRLPAILLTGYAGDAATLPADGAPRGAFSLLRKPVGAPQLADRAAALLKAAGPG